LSQKLLRDTRLYEQLFRYDRDLADEARELGCPCGGRLHRADYERKPWGGPPVPKGLEDADPGHSKRLSFCCDRDGCRERTTPPSTRFLGPRRYLAATVVLVSALAYGITNRRMERIRALYGISRKTVERWRVWWLETFAASDLWRVGRGRFAPSVAESRLPATLLERFGRPETRCALVGTLRFLASGLRLDHERRRAVASPQSRGFGA
jgi:hypothetical protein